jgi:hypothetical protein
MYSVANASLTVSILEPIADRERFGTRYCTGGYIFQVTDAKLGAVMSGPRYPDGFSTFDGQGIPDAFNLAPLDGPAGTGQALILGIGLCDRAKDTVLEFCQWEVAPGPTSLTFRTRHNFNGYQVDLERTVTLLNRTVRSATRLSNLGRPFLPVRWFPHPFYPQPAGDELCRFNVPFTLADSPGFTVAENGYVTRKAWPWTTGYFLSVDHAAQANLVVQQRHPLLGLVSATCSYVPAFMPIWGNHATFSWEPFYERTLGPGQSAQWWIDYDF